MQIRHLNSITALGAYCSFTTSRMHPADIHKGDNTPFLSHRKGTPQGKAGGEECGG